MYMTSLVITTARLCQDSTSLPVWMFIISTYCVRERNCSFEFSYLTQLVKYGKQKF